jgi:hypothetical protein
MAREPIRVLYAREHGTIYPGRGVFLAGPTPPAGRWHTLPVADKTKLVPGSFVEAVAEALISRR